MGSLAGVAARTSQGDLAKKKKKNYICQKKYYYIIILKLACFVYHKKILTEFDNLKYLNSIIIRVMLRHNKMLQQFNNRSKFCMPAYT